MERYFQTQLRKKGKLCPSLFLQPIKVGSVSKDCKFTITYDNMPDTLWSPSSNYLNIVEGIAILTLLCVIATEHGFDYQGMLNRCLEILR